MQQISEITYYPYSQAPVLAEGIAQLEQNNGTLIFENSATQSIDSLATCEAENKTQFVPGLLDITAAIQCGDILGSSNHTFQQARDNYQSFVDLSSLFATGWYPVTYGVCTYVPFPVSFCAFVTN